MKSQLKIIVLIMFVMIFFCSCSHDEKNEIEIGDIVILKGINEKIIVVGKDIESIDQNKKYDYLGYFYNTGYIGDNGNVFFDEFAVERVYHAEYKEK
ncbi:MAG TPA: hypothetical protein DC000_13420 [Clostridiales bacterium]|nr:hypothetical protein [Clostridiales bacterium]